MKIRAKLKAGWLKFKGWIVALLIAIGLISVPVLYAETVPITYTRATQYADGTPMALADIDETRLYCDGELIASEPGADQDFAPDLSVGSHDCYGTHVAGGVESAASNMITKVVQPPVPLPPVMNP